MNSTELEKAKAALKECEDLANGVLVPAAEGGAHIKPATTVKLRGAYARAAESLRDLIAVVEGSPS